MIIGEGECEKLELTDNRLTCLPPATQRPRVSGGLPLQSAGMMRVVVNMSYIMMMFNMIFVSCVIT